MKKLDGIAASRKILNSFPNAKIHYSYKS